MNLQLPDFLNCYEKLAVLSAAGWQRIRSARPNAAHRALAALEQAGRIDCLITQNVDNLHRLAGSARVIKLAAPLTVTPGSAPDA